MSMAKIATLVLWILAVLLFVIVGFDIVRSTEYNLVALGLACAWTGMIINSYVP